ncbi:protein cup [Anastrepha ludens]|uniref:protein cup n=1 Tax=Anastrepha ludens TaxID=28586 RepID=UPI0023B137EC|nr:protein cup [Anastrepha ludens]
MTESSKMGARVTNLVSKPENDESGDDKCKSVPMAFIEPPIIEVAKEPLEVNKCPENTILTPVRKEFEIPPPPPPTPVQENSPKKNTEDVKSNSLQEFKIMQNAEVTIKMWDEDCAKVVGKSASEGCEDVRVGAKASENLTSIDSSASEKSTGNSEGDHFIPSKTQPLEKGKEAEPHTNKLNALAETAPSQNNEESLKFPMVQTESTTSSSIAPPPRLDLVEYKPAFVMFKRELSVADARSARVQRLVERCIKTNSSVYPNAIPLPPPSHSIQNTAVNVTTYNDICSGGKPRKCFKMDTHKCHHQPEDEVLPLQMLPARSSTPYTQQILSCSTASCDLEHISEHTSLLSESDDEKAPVAFEQRQKLTQTQHKSNMISISKSVPVISLRNDGTNVCKSKSLERSPLFTHYSRAALLHIRNSLQNILISPQKQHLPTKHNSVPNIVDCDVIELEARLRRLNIWKPTNNQEENGGCRKYQWSRSNDMMPAFLKNKNIVDESIIKSQPPQPELKDSAVITNQRRIGSGRLPRVKWANTVASENSQSTYEKESSNKQVHNDISSKLRLLKLFETSKVDNMRNEKTSFRPVLNTLAAFAKNSDRSETPLPPASNANYVKRVTSGFLVVSNPKDRFKEDNERHKYNNHNEEPEWFSCGPTSRLDTIELCGFDDDEDQHGKKSDIKDNDNEISNDNDDTKENRNENANMLVSKTNTTARSGNEKPTNSDKENTKYLQDSIATQEERKSISFQYDQFSGSSTKHTHQQQHQHGGGSDSNGHHSPSGHSRFIPFFAAGGKKGHERVDKNGSSTSLNEFFQQALNAQKPSEQQQQKPALNSNVNPTLGDMPLVDELEAKWRRNSLTDRIKNNNNNEDKNNNNINKYKHFSYKHSQDKIQDSNNNLLQNSDSFKQLLGQLQSNNNNNNSNNNNNKPVQNKQSTTHTSKITGKGDGQNSAITQQQSQNQFCNENISNFILKQQQYQQQQQQLLLANLHMKAILSRPEAQYLLLGLAKGEISKHGLLVQLSNPRLPQRDREAITAVLTFTSTQQTHPLQTQFSHTHAQHQSYSSQQSSQQHPFEAFSNSLVLNQLQNLQNYAIMQQTLAAQQQHQHQQQSNIQRYPFSLQPMTTEELQNHTKSIMQNALAKRKFEEQQSNILGMQKILQLNAVATAAAAAVAVTANKQQQQHQQQQQQHQLATQSRLSGAGMPTATTSTANHGSQVNRTIVGSSSRRLQALQNLFNDSNGMVDSVEAVSSKTGLTNGVHPSKSQSSHSGAGVYRNMNYSNVNTIQAAPRRRSFSSKFTNSGNSSVPPSHIKSNTSDSEFQQQQSSSVDNNHRETRNRCHYNTKNDTNTNWGGVGNGFGIDQIQQQTPILSTGLDDVH